MTYITARPIQILVESCKRNRFVDRVVDRHFEDKAAGKVQLTILSPLNAYSGGAFIEFDHRLFAMEQFIDWYCSEPRLALIRTVVLRFVYI